MGWGVAAAETSRARANQGANGVDAGSISRPAVEIR